MIDRSHSLSGKQLVNLERSVYSAFASHELSTRGRSPDTAAPEELRRFQLHLVELGTSSITLNATITGLRFFFEETLNRQDALSGMSRVYELSVFWNECYWPEPFIRVAEICTNPTAVFWFSAVSR